ncbi:MAG: hypothetical protein QOK27_1122 [Gemmatimonadales bacterium]|nr:hypothetical protein [Gemmatimonadales bacterium]
MKGLAGGDPVQHLGRASRFSGNPPASSASVHRITHHWMPNVLQMDPDLVGSARMQLQPEQVGHIKAGNDTGFGPGGPTEG